MNNFGYVQYGETGTTGPFFTVKTPVRNTFADNWEALIGGRWRKVHIQVKRLYVVVQGKRYSIQIEGV